MWVAVVVAVVLAAGAGGAWWWWGSAERARDRAATAAVTAYAAGWQARDLARVAFVDEATKAGFATTVAGMGSTPVTVSPGEVRRDGALATADVDVTWRLAEGVTWDYTVPVQVTERDSRWAVVTPQTGSLWAPRIGPGDRLTRAAVPARRGDLLDRGGAALMPLGNVYPVQIDPSRATTASVTALAALVDEPATDLLARLEAAKKARSLAPIPVITYREADFRARKAKLDELTGVIYPRAEQPLARTRTFGQPLLGTFGPVTAEVVERSKGRYAAGDRAGLSGLQGQYDAVLAGTPGVSVTSNTGAVLFATEADAGGDVATTLDVAVQQAAEDALAELKGAPAAIAAVDVRTGEVRAAASSPSSGFDRAVTGRYAPGSAFKIASSYAFLTGGKVTPSTPVACPKTVTVDGKSFRNFDGEALGRQTFAANFAHSCNTAFISVARPLGDDALAAAARTLGLGADWGDALGVDGAFAGSVPTNTGATDKAAASIGQGRDEASPLSLAVMTGSIARGSMLPPVLVKSAGDRPAPTPSPGPVDAKAAAAVRAMMRQVVTAGTGSALRSVPGGAVSGKTGTAEFGTKTPPQTRAWFVGVQGDLAFAVLVEEGRSGGAVAAPVAASFLTHLAKP